MRPAPDRDRQPSLPLRVFLPALALLIVGGSALIWANKDNTPAAARERGDAGRFDERVARPPARADLDTPAPRVWEVLPGFATEWPETTPKRIARG